MSLSRDLLIWVNLPVVAFEQVITSLWKLRVEQYLLTASHDLFGFPILTLTLPLLIRVVRDSVDAH